MKKYIVLSLSLIMVLFCVVPVSASSSSMLTVGNVEGNIGDEIVVPISIASNPGFVSMSLYITYDTSALTLTSCEYTDVISGAIHSANYSSPYYLTWENDTLSSDITVTGTIAYLTFLVNDDASAGNYAVIARIPSDGILDADGNSVDIPAVQGTITVTEEHECTFGDWEDYSRTKHVRECDECGEKEYANHNWDDGKITEQPNHENEGEIKYTCEDCGRTKTTEIDPEGHDFSDWSKYDATQHKRSCSCGEVEYEDHNWDEGITAANIVTYTCDDCGATKTENVEDDTTDEIAATGISLSESKVTVTVGDNHLIDAIVSPDNATNKLVNWSSSNDSVVDIAWIGDNNAKGLIVAKSAGRAIITATTADGKYSAQCTVTVVADESTSDPDAPTIYIDDVKASIGESVEVKVALKNNPGVAMMRLKISYDASALTLNQVNYNADIGGTPVDPVSSDGSVVLLWYNGSANTEGDWVFATLSFTVNENANVGSISDIGLTYTAEEICDIEENNVHFAIDNGSVSINDHIPGDINGDNTLTSKDLLRLAKYFAGWEVEVNENALDINGDGNVNSKDLLRLAKYLAGWNVEIH